MWLVSQSVKNVLDQALANGIAPTAEQCAEYEAKINGRGAGVSDILEITGDVAKISISGVITNSPSFFALLFGGGNVIYSDIINALNTVENDASVARAELHIDSPGGTISGLFDTIAALQSFSKPLRAVVRNVAASAAYAIASQAGEIYATNRAVQFGSIGIVGSYRIDADTIDITSTNAPNKRPDPTTDEGKAAIREELDAVHALFVEAIASGRGVDIEKVNARFGQGATLLADEALKRGMIDAITGPSLRVIRSATTTTAFDDGGKLPEKKSMDLSTLKAQHSDVYAAAAREGVTQERDRVVAHLTMGEASGDMDTAILAINDGVGMTAALQAKYLSAGLKRRDLQARQTDDAALSAATGAQEQLAADDDAAEVLALVQQKLGIVSEAG